MGACAAASLLSGRQAGQASCRSIRPSRQRWLNRSRWSPSSEEAIEEDEAVASLFETAQQLEGLYRNASTHAAGIVIGDRPLVELVGLYRDPRSDIPASQFNMKWAEAAGLVKFDFLGLKTLTVIDRAIKMIRNKGVEIDLARLPLDDAKTYEMLQRGEVVGVFQVESAGMRRALVDMVPDRFEDRSCLWRSIVPARWQTSPHTQPQEGSGRDQLL
jgi:DNA polymerase III alpha subunit